jgi:urea carboxylase-associated protein 1
MPPALSGKRARIFAHRILFSLKAVPRDPNVATINLQVSPLLPENALARFIVEAGDPFVQEILRGQTVRIVDLEGNQAVDTLFYNAHDYADRYSAQDTIREQGNIYLTTGTRLISTEGNTLLTITADTCGRHDTLGGACAQESNMVRYEIEKRSMHACRQSFLKGLLIWKHGFEKRDLTSNINFFMNVPVTPEGKLTFEDGVSEAGKYVELRADMDVLMVVSNCPQLNNPCNAYNPTPVEILIWDAHVR